MLARQYLKDFPAQFFEQSIKALLSLLLVALLGTICAGTANTFIDLWRGFSTIFDEGGLHHSLRWILVDVLSVLAVVEVYRTAMTYFTEGRVKVTYIIDTVLVAVLTEMLAFWYREVDPTRMLIAIALVLTLMFVRIMAIRFSPKRRELCEGL
ncbi:hypothetical protein DESUT3_38660 [Desulfuromonas versatilis]|uniref:Phosphate-starvation-inducible E n=1 Tax=Desulfuromonas versatilis TaxID=2802975 RepID=A0ABM8I175_9BACT|nr:phosphate-starvation-inducible PsiE family protein [Desulfuromonas versatilis]BCR06797.1 hypothetical protein DESUT3_38660 [Desulfuromonas versatilis]